MDQPHICFHKMPTHNPASLLLDKAPAELLHSCPEVTDQIQSNKPDLTDVLLATLDQV